MSDNVRRNSREDFSTTYFPAAALRGLGRGVGHGGVGHGGVGRGGVGHGGVGHGGVAHDGTDHDDVGGDDADDVGGDDTDENNYGSASEFWCHHIIAVLVVGGSFALFTFKLFNEYYNRPDSSEDKLFKNVINRVIKVFTSRLFQAFLDIEEFYESIVLDKQADRSAKVNARLHLAEEWEKQPMLKRNIRNNIPMIESQTIASIVINKPISRPTNIKENSKWQPTPTPTPLSQIIDVHDGILNNRQNTCELHSSIHIIEFNYDNYWQEFEIDLERSSGIIGLGFSIAGRTDTPCISDSPAVIITRITEDDLADRDQRLKLHDIILRVNYMNFIHIEHQGAVDGLKATGNHVNMLIRRLAPSVMQQIRLNKSSNVHLDFSIAGEIRYEHVKGDYEISIRNIIPGGITDKNGRLKIDDRLMHVQSIRNGHDPQFVEHKHTVESIRCAYDENSTITLLVDHLTDYPGISNTQIQHTNRHRSPIHNNEQRKLQLKRRILLRRDLSGFGFNIVGEEVNHMRPVIVDPYKELLNNQLVDDRPDKLANWIPHTSRSEREKEVDGREYYFVATHEQIKKDIQNYLFIKAGKYGGNLYGTSVHAVQEVLNSSKHCILDISGHAIRGLITADLYSSLIFIKSRDVKCILDNIREEANEKRAQQIYEKSIKIEQQFEDILTAIIEEDTLSDVYDRIFDVIDHKQ